MGRKRALCVYRVDFCSMQRNAPVIMHSEIHRGEKKSDGFSFVTAEAQMKGIKGDAIKDLKGNTYKIGCIFWHKVRVIWEHIMSSSRIL